MRVDVEIHASMAAQHIEAKRLKTKEWSNMKEKEPVNQNQQVNTMGS